MHYKDTSYNKDIPSNKKNKHSSHKKDIDPNNIYMLVQCNANNVTNKKDISNNDRAGKYLHTEHNMIFGNFYILEIEFLKVYKNILDIVCYNIDIEQILILQKI